jgi:glyoxylase-like metal-dependent hydrolase (beta-lactamase superfamily II)
VPQKSDEVLGAIRSVTSKHILFIINTSADADHVGGNENLSKAGWALPDTSLNPLMKPGEAGLVFQPGASIIAHIEVLNRMSAPGEKAAPFPQGACFTTGKACSFIIRRMRTATETATSCFASQTW